MAKTIYMVAADYGGFENWYEAAFIDEGRRNEIALAIAEEVEHANFNLNVAAWMDSGMAEESAVEYALTCAKAENGWSYANEIVITWEVSLYE